MNGRDGALARPLVVLDDDPTGVQLLAGVRVLLVWDEARVSRALANAPAVHLLTNSRALQPSRARTIVSDAAATALRAAPEAFVLLRGDSTLRAHLLEEYLGLADAIAPGTTPPLLLVPGLPSAGRLTVGGVQLIVKDGQRCPLHETEYARDGIFAYRTARLLDWADERSRGFFRASNGVEFSLDALRADGGPERLAELLAILEARGAPAACVPDVESPEDLGLVARGVAHALGDEAEVFVRSSPGLVGPLAGTMATGLVAPPRTGRVLVVCGSWVPTTSRQVRNVEIRYPGVVLDVDIAALLSDHPDREIERVASATSQLLATNGVAVVVTPRTRSALVPTLADGERLATNLARIIPRLEPSPDVLVAKGGVTAAVALREGLGADEANVVGPLLPGVSLWDVRSADGDAVSYVVVPGNVGADGLLVDLIDLLRGPDAVAA